MGNCHKKNKVEPLVVKDSASEILSRGSQTAKPGGEQQSDMVKDLKDQGILSSLKNCLPRIIYLFIYLFIIKLINYYFCI